VEAFAVSLVERAASVRPVTRINNVFVSRIAQGKSVVMMVVVGCVVSVRKEKAATKMAIVSSWVVYRAATEKSVAMMAVAVAAVYVAWETTVVQRGNVALPTVAIRPPIQDAKSRKWRIVYAL